MMLSNNSGKQKLFNVIEPDKCIVENVEILGFENEEQLNFYTIWHEALVDKRRESNATSERERQIIRNEIARKTRQLIGTVSSVDETRNSICSTGGVGSSSSSGRQAISRPSSKRKSSSKSSRSSSSNHNRNPPPSTSSTTITTAIPTTAIHASANITPTTSPTSKRTSTSLPTHRDGSPISALAASRRALAAAVAYNRQQPGKLEQTSSTNIAQSLSAASHLRQGSANLPNGLTILNSSIFNTLPNGKMMMKYKLTKLYNKYRGRQLRRNFVNEKQRNARIEVEIGKSYLNSWLAYTALQALRLPETTYSLNATTTGNSKILTPMTQPITSMAPTKKTKSSSKKQQQQFKSPQIPQAQQQPPMQQQQQQQQKPPMHLVYIDPGNIITYSNRINPQQVAEYRQKSHLLPSSATSKKSSAASYDVYEIMEVLANTNKTHVTITRNANRPSQTGNATSIYSHSVNASTPGIVSTQLHLQARSYLDIMSKFYAEEFQRLEKEREEMKLEPSSEEQISKYLKNDHPYSSNCIGSQHSKSVPMNEDYQESSTKEPDDDDQEEMLESLEDDIRALLYQNKPEDLDDNQAPTYELATGIKAEM